MSEQQTRRNTFARRMALLRRDSFEIKVIVIKVIDLATFDFSQFDSFCISRNWLNVWRYSFSASHVPDNQAKLTLAISDILVLEVRPPASTYVRRENVIARALANVTRVTTRSTMRLNTIFTCGCLNKNAMSSKPGLFLFRRFS